MRKRFFFLVEIRPLTLCGYRLADFFFFFLSARMKGHVARVENRAEVKTRL